MPCSSDSGGLSDIDTGTLLGGLASFGGYLLLSGAVARARLTTTEITC